MSTVTELAALKTRVDNLQAMVQGVRYQGLYYAVIGSSCVFGMKITAGYSSADMVLALEGNAAGDSAHLNPDAIATPVRPEQHYNIACIYGEVFLRANVNTATLQDAALTVTAAPGGGYHRYDIAYAYVTSSGPQLGIAAGTAVANASTPSDPLIPQGTLALARVHVTSGMTAIANSDITDLRAFASRLSMSGDSIASFTAQTIAARDVALSASSAANISAGTAQAAWAAALAANPDLNPAFRMNPSTLTADLTIASGYNALSAGPLTIAEGTTITVLPNARWNIV
jgi:hypothetical protein